ncbi:MAG: DUF5050 domain-containing protein, partial [Clostridia bacterium]
QAENSRYCPNCGNPLFEEAPLKEQKIQNNTAPDTETAEPVTEPATAPEVPAMEAPAEEPAAATPPPGNEAPETPGERPQPNTPPTTAYQDPFEGPPHPSLKKNLLIIGIIGAVVVVLITIMSIFSIAAMAIKDSYDPVEESTVEEEISAPGNIDDIDVAADAMAADAGNIANGGFALTDNEGQTYYINVDTLYFRDDMGNDEYLTSSGLGYYGFLNKVGPYLYFVTDYEDMLDAEIDRYNTETGEEEMLWESDDEILFMTIIDETIYFESDDTVYTADLNCESVTPLFEAEDDFALVSITKDGIFYTEDSDNDLGIYRRDLNGANKKKIGEGYTFRVDGERIYINSIDENGADTIIAADLDGENAETVYNFKDPDIYIESFLVRDGTLFCATETDKEDQDSAAIYAINMENGKTTVIAEEKNCHELPYYGLNLAGDLLFYCDDNDPYGIQIYELNTTTATGTV